MYLYLNYLQFAFSKSLRCQRQDKAAKSDPSPILLTIVNILKVTLERSIKEKTVIKAIYFTFVPQKMLKNRIGGQINFLAPQVP